MTLGLRNFSGLLLFMGFFDGSHQLCNAKKERQSLMDDLPPLDSAGKLTDG